jgi:antitoxin (DNA-binding transcriptional repressor) of toxin-antitoxin stability system
MGSMTITEARASLPELIDRVEDGEEITITRHGRAVALVVRPEALALGRAETVFANADRVHELLAAARGAARSTSAGLSVERAEELVREIRAGREAR